MCVLGVGTAWQPRGASDYGIAWLKSWSAGVLIIRRDSCVVFEVVLECLSTEHTHLSTSILTLVLCRSNHNQHASTKAQNSGSPMNSNSDPDPNLLSDLSNQRAFMNSISGDDMENYLVKIHNTHMYTNAHRIFLNLCPIKSCFNYNLMKGL